VIWEPEHMQSCSMFQCRCTVEASKHSSRWGREQCCHGTTTAQAGSRAHIPPL
jgi:hypothetical protein